MPRLFEAFLIVPKASKDYLKRNFVFLHLSLAASTVSINFAIRNNFNYGKDF